MTTRMRERLAYVTPEHMRWLTRLEREGPKELRQKPVRALPPRFSRPGKGDAPTTLGLMLLLAVLCLIWFVSLGTRSLITPDEGRYATLALEMARSGDWVTPRLNGLLYFEKPVFQYWVGALAFLVFGVSDFTARLWPGVAGFLTLLAVGLTAGRLWGRETGIRAFAVVASMTWVIGNSHFLTLDAGLTLFLTLALCAVLLANDIAPANVRPRRRWIWLAWAAMAAAVLSKGLVGIAIPGAVLVLVTIWRRNLQLWRGMHWFSGLLIFLVLAAPWFVLVSERNPAFAQFFFIHEHWQRYVSNVHQRVGAWWYYVPILLGGMLPWTGALPWLFRKAPDRDRPPIAARDILLVWCVFVFLFFSASGSKLPSYILPMYPALALLVAMQLRDVSVTALRWHLLVPVLAWTLVFVVSTETARSASPSTSAEMLQSMGAAVPGGATVFLVGAVIAWWCLGRRKVTAAILSLAFCHLIGTTVVMQSHDAYGQLKSAAALAPILRREITPDAPVFSVRTYDQTLPFYLGRHVVLVDYFNEFAFGEVQEPERWVKTLDEFVARWQSLPQAAAYMERDTWVELQQRGLPMRIVYQDQRRMVVAKK